MNNQIRRIFIVVLIMFALLGAGMTNTQFVAAPALNADERNQRAILHSAEIDRGPIIVNGSAVASSTKQDDSQRFERSYSQGPLYASVTGYFSSVISQSTGLESAAEEVLDGQSQSLFAQRCRGGPPGRRRRADPQRQDAAGRG